MVNTEKISSYIGFAVRAGKVIIGSDSIVRKKRRRKLIIMCNTIGENTRKLIKKYAEETGSPLVVLDDITLEDILKKKCKVLAVTDENLAKAIIGNASAEPSTEVN